MWFFIFIRINSGNARNYRTFVLYYIKTIRLHFNKQTKICSFIVKFIQKICVVNFIYIHHFFFQNYSFRVYFVSIFSFAKLNWVNPLSLLTWLLNHTQNFHENIKILILTLKKKRVFFAYLVLSNSKNFLLCYKSFIVLFLTYG